MNNPGGGPPPSATTRRWIWPVALLLLLLAGLAALWWWSTHRGGGNEAQRDQLRALLERQKTLEGELAQARPADPASCPPGQSLKPIAAVPGTLPGALPGALPGSAPPPPAPGASMAALPTTGEAPALGDAALAQRLEQATAIVLVNSGSQGTGMGTGFFISPNLIVTNRHVVEGSTGPGVFVSSKSLGTLRRATVLKVTRNADIGNPDFALLRLEDGTSQGALDLAPEAPKLAGVVAAGYPAVVVQNDVNFQRLLRGDVSAAPDLNLTKGSVQSLQPGPDGTPLMVHTASIAKGNSGGPLVDNCGRVVGVNTFINVDQSQSAKINYAIRSQAVAGFVQAAGATARVDARPCASKG